MKFDHAFIPFGAYWTTPFCKWQGSFAALEPIPFAAEMAAKALAARNIAYEKLDGLVFGTTIPSHHSFYGAPWLAGLLGAAHLTGPTISQACATSARCLAVAAQEVMNGGTTASLVVAADRTSNGPHLYYPKPDGPGGTGVAENWVLDNFSHDPFAKGAMIATAENAARELNLSREAQDAIAVLRSEQYRRALADDAAFHARYMLPVEVKNARGKVVATITDDEGVTESTAEGLAKLRPLTPDGTVTFGTQTHPADGNAGAIVTTRDLAREWARDAAVEVQLLSLGQARVKPGFMPLANAPAMRVALKSAGIGVGELAAITTHNPFAVNDLAICHEFDIQPDTMNRYGCSLVWGHPQAPTGLRAVIELIEELALRGGGYGLFTGCAAGDSAMALVLNVSVA